MEVVISRLSSILSNGDAQLNDIDTWPPRIRQEVARWLSDWHLVSFLCMQGLFSLVSCSVIKNPLELTLIGRAEATVSSRDYPCPPE